MQNLIGETDFYFVAEGLEPLACEPVIHNMILPERLGEWECEVELDQRVGVEEVKLDVEERSKIANYLHKHINKLLRRLPDRDDHQALIKSIFWLRHSVRLSEIVEIIQLPIGE